MSELTWYSGDELERTKDTDGAKRVQVDGLLGAGGQDQRQESEMEKMNFECRHR